MKKVATFVFPFIALLYILILWQIVSSQHWTDNAISLKDAATISSSASNNHITPDGRIDINSASSQELQLLPGIGEKLAHQIILYRESHGPFVCTEDLLKIKGISSSKLQAIEKYLYIE